MVTIGAASPLFPAACMLRARALGARPPENFHSLQDDVIFTEHGKLKITFFFFKGIDLFQENVSGINGKSVGIQKKKP